jgi:hypothetical protein
MAFDFRTLVSNAIWSALEESPGVHADKSNNTIHTWFERENMDMNTISDNVLDELGMALFDEYPELSSVLWR